MNISPHDKAMMDSVIDVRERHQAARARIRWCVVAVASVVIGLLVLIESLPWWLRMTFAVISVLGFLLFLIYLSTTQIGKDIADLLS